MVKMVFKGMKRRRKEINYVSIVTFIAVVFMTGITLYQNVMNNYMFHQGLNTYGNWIVASTNQQLSHPYFSIESTCVTGNSLVDEEGKVNLIYMGKADENFTENYGQILYEGRFPETENEITMDTTSLAVLGYSYELGQTIQVSYSKDAETMIEKEYELVGVLKNYALVWKTAPDYKLPNFFVCEEEFEKYTLNKSKTYFYQLDTEYNDINTLEFANAFVDENGDKPVVYNSYVYENKVWGATEIFEKVTAALMVIEMLAISYLLMAYTEKRRPIYYRYRCIGASKNQVKGIVAIECLYATIPQVLLGILCSYGLVLFGCWWIEHQFLVKTYYAFDKYLLYSQLLVSFGIVLLAAFIALLRVNDKRLVGNSEAIKPTKFEKLRKFAKKSKCPEKTLIQRQKVLYPMQNVLAAFFAMLVCGALLFCEFKIYDSVENNQIKYALYEDFAMEYDEVEEYKYEYQEEDGHITVYTFSPSSLWQGLDETMIDIIESSPGIKEISYTWKDGVHYLVWEDMKDSLVLQYFEQYGNIDTPLVYGTEMVFYEDIEKLQQESSFLEEDAQIDWEKVKQGEQVILRISLHHQQMEFVESGQGTYEELIENTLQSGETVYITDLSGKVSVPVTVGAVVYENTYRGEVYEVIGTKALAEKLAVAENQPLKYNYMEITYDENASYESTDKMLSVLATHNGMTYFSNAELHRMSTNQMIQDIGLYGSLFLVIFVIYQVLQSHFLESKNKYRRQQYIAMRRIGMEKQQYFRMVFWAECNANLWILAGILVGYLLIGYFYWMEQYAFNGLYMWESTCIALSALEHAWFIGMAIFIYILTTLHSAHIIRKSLQEVK